jgi:ribose-phosphate pyrophosphokinase
MNNARLIAGRSNLDLATKISQKLNIKLTDIKFTDFMNGEMAVQILDNIRNYDAFIIQTGSSSITNEGIYHSINDNIIELELIINACKLSSANFITVIIPNFPYARSDKKDLPRTSLSGSYIASKLKFAGANRLVSMDLHSGQIQGFTDIPFDNLYAIKLFVDYLTINFFQNNCKSNFILISPDAGGIKRVTSYAHMLKMNHVIMHKQRDYTQVSKVTNTFIIGDVESLKNKTAIIIDDIIDTMGTMIQAAEKLETYGIKNIIIIATHGILSGPAVDRINNCKLITDVVITNTLDQTKNTQLCSKIKVVDTSDLYAEVIKRLIYGYSISELFI